MNDIFKHLGTTHPNMFFQRFKKEILFFRVQWMFDYLGMVCLAGNQVWWTWEVEDVFEHLKKGVKTAMKDFAKKQHSQIDDLVVQVGFSFFLFFPFCVRFLLLDFYSFLPEQGLEF